MRLLREIPNELRRNLRVGIGAEGNISNCQLFSQVVKIDQRAIMCQGNNSLVN